VRVSAQRGQQTSCQRTSCQRTACQQTANSGEQWSAVSSVSACQQTALSEQRRRNATAVSVSACQRSSCQHSACQQSAKHANVDEDETRRITNYNHNNNHPLHPALIKSREKRASSLMRLRSTRIVNFLEKGLQLFPQSWSISPYLDWNGQIKSCYSGSQSR
jgi:biopolymer transport protein ExbB/TolQ